MALPFIGEIRIVCFNYAPVGWKICNGQLLDISSYLSLFSILNNTYGGDGRSNFGLPSLEGRSPIHEGNGPGLHTYRLGQLGGVEHVTLNQQQVATHNHTWRVASAVGNQSVFTNHALASTATGRGAVPIYNTPSPTTNITEMRPETLGPSGAGASHYNMQPSLAIYFIIAYEGTYPRRP